jgi:ATP synthase F1 gamma subunit
MKTKKVLEGEINNLIGLSGMVKAYEEIAAGRIKQSRDNVLKNRDYMSEIVEIFEEVLFTYKKQVEVMMKAKKKKNLKEFSFINKNGKTLYILLSANTGLYGNIVKRTFDLFISKARETNADKAIIGKLGLSMWQQAGIRDQYYYFDFPDQRVDKEPLKKILDFIVSYESIVVFYGKFQNLVTQEPTYSDISGNALSGDDAKQQGIKYFFEPSLDKVLEFFEKQIFSSIFEQTMRESQLAKIASRLTSLDTASENIDKQLEMMKSAKIRIEHHVQNKKQLETFSSSLLWNR